MPVTSGPLADILYVGFGALRTRTMQRILWVDAAIIAAGGTFILFLVSQALRVLVFT